MLLPVSGASISWLILAQWHLLDLAWDTQQGQGRCLRCPWLLIPGPCPTGVSILLAAHYVKIVFESIPSIYQ